MCGHKSAYPCRFLIFLLISGDALFSALIKCCLGGWPFKSLGVSSFALSLFASHLTGHTDTWRCHNTLMASSTTAMLMIRSYSCYFSPSDKHHCLRVPYLRVDVKEPLKPNPSCEDLSITIDNTVVMLTGEARSLSATNCHSQQTSKQ